MNRALFFDFDGVVLDSVNVKTKAFYQLMLPHGEDIAEKALEYHLEHGGISRYEKFKYYYKELLKKPLSDEKLQELGSRFSDLVFEEVLRSKFIPGVEDFISKAGKYYDRYVVSGTPETELSKIVQARGLDHYFKEVHGSPRKKPEITKEILQANQYEPSKCFFFGDASTDLDAARQNAVQFILVRSKENQELEGKSDLVISDFFDPKLKVLWE